MNAKKILGKHLSPKAFQIARQIREVIAEESPKDAMVALVLVLTALAAATKLKDPHFSDDVLEIFRAAFNNEPSASTSGEGA